MGVAAFAVPAHATSFGSNGRIAFSTDNSEDPGDPQIFTADPNGSNELQLTTTETGRSSSPDISPDGTKIVFTRDDDSGNGWQIYVMGANGNNVVQLTFDDFDHYNPRFSPTGSQIAFSACPFHDTCPLYIMNADGSGTPLRLTSIDWNSGDPEFSPDGSKIVFDSNQDGLLSAVWVMNVDGSNQVRLTAPQVEAFFPDWSPDGAHIIFTDRCCLPYSNVWVMNPDGTGLKQLTHMPAKHNAGFASYSPDGKKILLESDLKSKAGSPAGDLYTMDANGTHLARVISDQPTVLLSDWGSAS